MNRRNFLKNSLMTAATISTFAGLMIKPKRVFAAWPKESFDITDLGQSIKSVYGHNNLEENSKVKLKVPDTVSYTHLRAHETPEHLGCRVLL